MDVSLVRYHTHSNNITTVIHKKARPKICQDSNKGGLPNPRAPITQQHRRNSKSIKNIYKKSSILGSVLSQFWGLGPSWGHLGISKAQTYIPSLILYRFCVPIGTPLGTQKSHWVPPNGHGSLQRCVFDVSFSGPTFSLNML